ncbi:uncharacterized protein LOC122292959 isoform X2 [Carya illinoinensis]|uniref:uncharacterized protein LOC122292959 isoform X2 n=1 Tax=Carya illinoinensis TaxID=32201 RepID=UPI001C71949A|nr:uncharacterized protein LOC122292959 isoform X2 [Carya illinoinensis]
MVKTEKSFSVFPAMQHKENQVLAPPRASDPGWAHGIMVNGGRQKIKCKYCHKIMLGGGISRLKQHLAGERGNVAPCEEVPEDVKVQMQQHLGFKVLERLKRQKGLKNSKDSMSYSQDREEGDDGDSVQIKTMIPVRGSGKRRGKEVVERISNRSKRHKKQYFSTVAPVVAHSIHQSLASQESMDQADMAVARFLYEAGIQFTAANSQYFQEMADAIAAVGPGYKMPSYHSLRGKLLNRSVQDVSEYVEELRKSWEVTGCSVMVDRWMDRTGRTVINFFVYCPKGTIFLKSVDASDITSPETLLNLFDGVVQEVGQKNIVNFLTDTSPSYKEAGKLLMEKYKTFFCTACGSHCIDLILEEIGKIDLIKEVLAKTRQGHLHQMFTGAAWMNSNFSKQRVGLEVAEIIVDPLFWSMSDQTLKVTKPLLSVLQLVHSGEKPSVGIIYDAMEKAKKTIIVAFENKESDYLPYLEVINRIWQEEFHSPLHAAAYYLNPSIFYNPSFSSNKVIQKGLLDCIETLEPDLTAQVMITSNVNFYEEAVGDFGRPVALRGRESLAPATWWSLYAADYPDLQRLAVRILSQTCNISRCERSWSMFERIHLKKRNRLEHQRLNDLIFVHYNLRLQERRPEASKARIRRGTLDPMCLEAMDANMGDWVEDPGVLEGEDLSWMDVTVPSETSFVSHKLKDLDDCNDSTDGRDSDDMRGMDDNDDL